MKPEWLDFPVPCTQDSVEYRRQSRAEIHEHYEHGGSSPRFAWEYPRLLLHDVTFNAVVTSCARVKATREEMLETAVLAIASERDRIWEQLRKLQEFGSPPVVIVKDAP